jgi:hypothetical protein
MARLLALVLALLTVSALAGCSDAGDGGRPSTSTGPTGHGSTGTTTAADACPSVGEDTGVAGWTAHGGRWGEEGVVDGRADIVCGKATGAVQSLVHDSGTYSSFEANVTFDMLAGDSGAGLVFHFADEENFNIVRYSIREQGWHLFTMIDGERQKEENATVEGPTTNPELHEWVELRVVAEDGVVMAYDGETKVIDFELPEGASHQGRIGYFLRDAGMVAAFDAFSVQAR